jgi:hypothetical protein
MWRKIGEITGAGHVPAGEESAIALTDVVPGKIDRIEKLLSGAEEDKAEAKAEANSTKRGNK